MSVTGIRNNLVTKLVGSKNPHEEVSKVYFTAEFPPIGK
jgi:hypothetical protein